MRQDIAADEGFARFHVMVNGRRTTISMDPLLANLLKARHGDEGMMDWLNRTASLVAAAFGTSRRAGLSRLLQRHVVREVADPRLMDAINAGNEIISSKKDEA